MSPTTFAIVLLAAALHAGWNAIVKGGSDTFLTTALVTGTAAVLAAVCLPFLEGPAAASWPFIAASVLLQIVYFLLVARIYHLADLSLAYPLMRGTAPLIVAIAGATVLREALAPAAWLGIAVICAGVLAMAAGGRPGPRRGIALALLNACVIAGYTLVDGVGVRASGAPAAYTLWIFLMTGLPLAGWALATRRAAFLYHARANWPKAVIGGGGTVLAYGLSLWAMTSAPVATVAALRETSILFAMLISALVLGERVGTRRTLTATAIALGAILLRLS